MASPTGRILILYAYPTSRFRMRVTIRRHLEVLEWGTGRHSLLYYNALRGAPPWLRRLSLDAVILHTTLLCMRWNPRFREWKPRLDWIRGLPCRKIAMPQDEYDHAHVLDDWLRDWGVSFVFSNFGPEQRSRLYPTLHDRADFRRCLTGYIDGADAERWAPRLLPMARRPLDVVYRATRLPYWFGSHGQLKHRLGEAAARRAGAFGLRCDISTRPADTIVGARWLDFLASARAVVGCESGSSVLDRRGEIRSRVEQLLAHDAALSFDEVARQMPAGWDAQRFFAVSPRHLEAVVTRTCQILVAGSYSGVLEANRHYIPLSPDLSDLDEALARLRDHQELQRMVDRAYREVYLDGRHTYEAFAREVESVLGRPARQPLGPRRLAGELAWLAGQAAGLGAAVRIVAGDWLRGDGRRRALLARSATAAGHAS